MSTPTHQWEHGPRGSVPHALLTKAERKRGTIVHGWPSPLKCTACGETWPTDEPCPESAA